MKRLFVTHNHVINVDEHKRLFEVLNDKGEYVTLDWNGNPSPEPFADTNTSEKQENTPIRDPEQFDEVVNGFYTYTSHPCTLTSDGFTGCFGLKREDGKKITEEIFHRVGYFSNGVCAVCNAEDKWGCINEKGEMVIPYRFCETPIFNKYGVACGDNVLIDMNGNTIPGTELNFFDGCCEEQRFYTIAMLSPEIEQAIEEGCGSASGITEDFYDTKLLKYVARGIPDGKLKLDFCDAEEEVISAAVELVSLFDQVEVMGKGTIIGKKNDKVTVYYMGIDS